MCTRDSTRVCQCFVLSSSSLHVFFVVVVCFLYGGKFFYGTRHRSALWLVAMVLPSSLVYNSGLFGNFAPGQVYSQLSTM